jgi:hypothetical protein
MALGRVASILPNTQSSSPKEGASKEHKRAEKMNFILKV